MYCLYISTLCLIGVLYLTFSSLHSFGFVSQGRVMSFFWWFGDQKKKREGVIKKKKIKRPCS